MGDLEAALRWLGVLAAFAAAGWPLTCDGDPETVMGLPSRLVLPIIRGSEAA